MIRRLAVRARRLNAGVAVLLGLIAFGAAAASAQQSLSTVQRHVIDESGAVVPGATVVLRDGERGLVRTEVTDGQGFYTVRLIPSGTYDLETSLSGFQTVRREAGGTGPTTSSRGTRLFAASRSSATCAAGGQPVGVLRRECRRPVRLQLD